MTFQDTPTTKLVIAEKNYFKGFLMGHISNGKGEIEISNGKSIKFIALDDKFVKIQLIENGIGVPIKTQTWQKTKKVIEKKIVEKIIKEKKIEKPKFKLDKIEEM